MSATARECGSVGDGLAPSVVASSVELHKAAPLCAPAAARPWDAEKTERWLEEVRQARGGGLCDPFEQDWEAVLQSVDQTTMLGYPARSRERDSALPVSNTPLCSYFHPHVPSSSLTVVPPSSQPSTLFFTLTLALRRALSPDKTLLPL